MSTFQTNWWLMLSHDNCDLSMSVDIDLEVNVQLLMSECLSITVVRYLSRVNEIYIRIQLTFHTFWEFDFLKIFLVKQFVKVFYFWSYKFSNYYFYLNFIVVSKMLIHKLSQILMKLKRLTFDAFLLKV